MAADQSVVVLDLYRPRFSFLAWFLNQAGFRSLPVHSVEQALDSLQPEESGIVVVNSDAPANDVAETVASLHRLEPRPLVVAFANAESGAEAIGADLTITRPTDVDDIIAPLREALRDRVQEERPPQAAGGSL